MGAQFGARRCPRCAAMPRWHRSPSLTCTLADANGARAWSRPGARRSAPPVGRATPMRGSPARSRCSPRASSSSMPRIAAVEPALCRVLQHRPASSRPRRAPGPARKSVVNGKYPRRRRKPGSAERASPSRPAGKRPRAAALAAAGSASRASHGRRQHHRVRVDIASSSSGIVPPLFQNNQVRCGSRRETFRFSGQRRHSPITATAAPASWR